MEIIEVQQRIEACIDKLETVLKAYHKSKTEYENIKEMQKVTLAVYEQKYDGAQDQIKRNALADVGYEEFLGGLKEARSNYNRAWANLQALQIEAELLRSLNKHLQ